MSQHALRNAATRKVGTVLILVALLVTVFPRSPAPTLAASGLKVQYKAYAAGAAVSEIAPWFQIVNTGASAVDLSTVRLRYWYTADATNPTQVFNCDWAQIGCAAITAGFVKLASPTPGADYYVELAFSSTSLAAGASSGEIQDRFHKSDWSNYTQTGDYSFDPTKTAYADWSQVTLYQNGVLVWGTEPAGSGPTATPAPTNTPGAPTATRAPTNTPGAPTATPTASTIPPWSGNGVAYHVGDLVTYQGSIYRCITAHTSQPDWTPSAAPSLWALQTGPTAPPTTATPAPPSNTPAPPTSTPASTTPPTATPTPGGPTNTPTPTLTAPPAGRQVVGYFTEWGIYGRNYQAKNLATSGSAGKMTMLLYAFSNISNGQCAIGDSYADYDKFYDAGSSVSGVADTWDTGALRGSFHQLQELKALYPNLKVMISIGGWTWSSGFSAAAMTASSRQAFVSSCLNTFIQGNFASGLSYPGIFDGVDVDWEYPGACGNTCNYSPQDPQNFTALLAEFRSQLNALTAQTGHRYYLSIAAPAGSDKFNLLQLGSIHPYLDNIDLMTYDLHGAWEGTTNFQAALYHSSGDPSQPPANTYYADYAVQAYKAAGVPANKLVLGVPFYGRGWTNVPNVNNGLYQPSTTAAPGTYEAGIEDYHVLKNLTGYSAFRHAEAQAFWIFNGSTFWNYDDPASMTNKMSYVKSQGLGGAMFWEASGDDPTGSLITAVYNGLR